MTDCNNCKHETECNYTERYDYKNKGIVDYQTDKDIESYSEIADMLNKQDARIKELEDKLNQTALFFLNYNMITMGKAVEISEMSYFDFLKYRKENGNPMELQL